MCSGVGWVRGRLPAGSGCQGLTVGGSSAVSPWCVPWRSLVGWLKGVFGVYRIHWGTTVCRRAAAGRAVGCGGGACVGVVRVVGGGASCVVLGGSSWRSVVVVPGRWSWAWRFLGGCGTCGVGFAGGGARVCVGLLVCLPLPPRFLRLPFPCPSLFAWLFCFVCFFLRGGRLGCGFFGAGCWCGCVQVPVLVWAWVSWGMGVGWLLRSGFPVCLSAPRHLVASGFRGAGPGDADSRWLAAVVAWRLRAWSRLPGSAWVAWPGAGVRGGVFVAWANWLVGSVGLAGLCGWWDGAGTVSGMCAPKAWWVGLGPCGRCIGGRRCC